VRNAVRHDHRSKKYRHRAAHYDASSERDNGDRITVRTMTSQTRTAADCGERRNRTERRRRRVWSICYGSFNPRRRTHPRRAGDLRFHSLDWYSAHLLAVAMGISVLSMADAFLTVTLLNHGAVEVNPLMAALLHRGAAAFTIFKMTTTSVCVLALVVLSRHRFMRLIRVEIVMYVVLGTYLSLIGYELWLLQKPWDVLLL
jgi:hypothetical protein